MNDTVLARHLAFKYHDGQKYGEEPYITHLMSVATSAKSAYPNDERYEIIGWLHDILEDTACTEEILRALFDKDVVAAVVALTHNGQDSREEYLVKVKANALAREVKLHDAFANMQASFFRYDKRRVRKYAQTILTLTE